MLVNVQRGWAGDSIGGLRQNITVRALKQAKKQPHPGTMPIVGAGILSGTAAGKETGGGGAAAHGMGHRPG